ncbi:hypothetical protein LARI1_G004808 [Lachnellula arida]|uniref:Uncharacterized protein n=1 Tax=Lachnellula arida TaxID=1316785 RepID=A0A8T9BHT3_9HELO|nr:hypothetical protein LARI1_G004808 [Lachnellula arida]
MANFRDLPSELRNRIYELCLLHQEPIDPWTHHYPRQDLTPGLLLANKTIHREANPLLYAQNRFDFTSAAPEDVASFLGTIGHNAEYIRHICINFPSLRHLEPGNVALEEGSIGIFAHIQSRCANLSTLTTALNSTNDTVLQLDALDHPKTVTEALTLVDTCFSAILSLQYVIVQVYEDGPSGYIKSQMENLGWTVSETEYVDEWGSERSFDDDYWNRVDRDGWDDDDDDDGDSYDIDNDITGPRGLREPASRNPFEPKNRKMLFNPSHRNLVLRILRFSTSAPLWPSMVSRSRRQQPTPSGGVTWSIDSEMDRLEGRASSLDLEAFD